MGTYSVAGPYTVIDTQYGSKRLYSGGLLCTFSSEFLRSGYFAS